MNIKIDTGRNFCQHKIINLSYRYRGNLDRINKKIKNKIKNRIGYMLFKNRTEVIILKNKIIPYSPTKIKAKGPLEYSVLNPETSSDSPSEKSKGARLHSATQDRYQISRTGKLIIINEHVETFLRSCTDKKLFNKITQNSVKEKEIS